MMEPNKDLTFRAEVVNKFLVCSLCTGYFREPYTVRECLHTFCKSCIFKYFQYKTDCPTCHYSLAPKPFDSIRYDRTLHELVNKIFADLIEEDEENKRKFYEEKGLDMAAYEIGQPTKRQKTASEKEEEENNNTTTAPPKTKRAKDEIVFKLQYYPEAEKTEEEEGLKELNRPIITTSARVTVRHLKKFLQKELGLLKSQQVDLLFKNEVLGSEHTLQFVLKTRGHTQGELAIFHYRKKKNLDDI